MKIIEILENQSIGPIELGMDRKNVYNKLGIICDNHEEHEWIGDFHIGYTYEKVSFIELSSTLLSDSFVLFKGVDVFRTEARLLIKYLSNFGDCEIEEDGYSYRFPTLGIGFWRPIIFDYEMIYDADYKNMSEERLKEELKYLYFEAVSIFDPHYYSK